MQTILEVKKLSKHFENTSILNDINLTVHQEDFIAIMGQSGSGKSTMLYNISGMDKPTSGKVIFRDKELSQLSDEETSKIRLEHMGFIFQHSYLLKNLSIRDNIILPGFKASNLSREQVNNNADILMKKTNISHIADHDVKKVSGGELQRAAICRALINQPDVLFADEPTGALNSSNTTEVMDIINSINREGTTVILVTHDAKVAARASKVIYLLDGNIHDKLELGRYDGNENTKDFREKKLFRWLESLGF